MRLKSEKIILLVIFLLVTTFAATPSQVLATINIGTPSFTKNTVYEQEEVVMTVLVVSDKDVTGVTVEMKKSSLDLVNVSYSNYTVLRVGSATSGNWIYFFKEKAGIYQITKVIATDNSSVTESRNFDTVTIAFRVLASPATTTTTTTPSQNTSTTTSSTVTSAPPSATTTATTTASETENLIQRLLQSKIVSVLIENPIYIAVILLIIIIPVIALMFIWRKKPAEKLPEPEKESPYSDGV